MSTRAITLRSFVRLVGAALVGATLTTPVLAGDEVTPITFGEVVDGAIDFTTDVDTYTFTATPGQVVFLDRLAATNSNSLNWSLVDPLGRVYAKTTSFNDLGAFTLIGGEYEIIVSGEKNQVGTYSFTLHEASVDEGAITLGAELSGEIAVPGDVDRWTYTSTKGQRVSLDFRGGTAAQSMEWRLVDDLGREILAPTNSLADNGPYTLPGGEVLLEVRGENGNDAVGTYDFAVLTVPDGTDAAVALGDTLVDAIDVWGEVDRFSFSAAPGDRISIDVSDTPSFQGLNLVLRDAFGRAVLGPTTSLSDQPSTTLMGGDYVLEVFAEKGSSGIYTLDLRQPPSDSVQDVAIGDTLNGQIDVYGETETWRFTAAPGQIVSLDNLGGLLLGLNWELVDELGRAVLPKTTSISDVNRIALTGGVYDLNVTAELGVTDAYDIKVHDVVDLVDVPLTFDTVVTGSLAVPGQRATYTFNAPPGQVVFLDRLSVSNNLGTNWSLEDSLGRSILERTGNLNDQGPFTLMGGDYSLTVYTETGATSDYDITVVDQGIDTSYVPPLPTNVIGDTIAATLSDVGATDVYAFDAAGETLYFDRVTGSNQLRWTLRDPVGQAIFDDVSMNSANTSDRGPYPLAAGTYTLEIRGTGSSTPDYEVRIAEVVDGGGPIALGAEVTDVLLSSGGVNRHPFTLATDTRAFFDLTTSNSALDWRLFDAAGEAVFDAPANSTNSSDRGPYDLRAGEYVVEFDGDFAATPEYAFAVYEIVDVAEPITIGTPIAATLDTPGGTKTYTLDVTDGQRVVFDNQQGNNSLRWDLVDPVGQPVFAPVGTASATGGDQGPFELAAGQYTLTYDATTSSTFDYGFQVLEVVDGGQVIALETDVTDTSAVPRQVFRYPLSLAADTSLFFDGQFGVNNITWTLFDEYGQVVFGPSEFHTGTNDQGPFGLAAGDYELVVEPGGLVDATFGFSVHEVNDVVGPLAVGTPVSTSIPGPGASLVYDIDVTDGQRLIFEVTQSTDRVRWTFSDPFGDARGFFDDADASDIGSDDQGPFDLLAGSYTLEVTGENQFAEPLGFLVRNVDQDLRPRSVELSAPVLFAEDVGRTTDVTWVVDNLGGPDDLLGAWTDRLVLSNDDQLGDADDIVLGEFVVSGPVASMASYERTETVAIPDEVGLGDYRVYAVVDALDDVVEFGGEDTNALDAGLSVVPQTNGDNDCIDFDQVDGAEFPAGSVIALSGRAAAIEGAVNVVYVIDVSTSTQNECGFDSNFDGIVDENDDINGDAGVSSQPANCDAGTILDSELGATLLLDDFLGQTSDLSHAVVVFSDAGKAGDLGPEDGFQIWSPHGRDQDENGERDFETSLRSTFSIGFIACAFGTGLNEFTKVQVGCGTDFRTAHVAALDALLAANPSSKNIVVFLSDGEAVPLTAIPTPDEVAALGALGVDFRGYQLGGEEITESMQYMADSIDAQPGSTGLARSVLDLNDLLFELVQSVSVQAVTVNGVGVDSLDATGRFFQTVEIMPGPNVFVVESVDGDGNSCLATITLNGVLPEDGAFDDLSIVTTSLDTDWLNTTVNQFDENFVVSARAENVGDTLVRGPLLMVIDGPSDPTVVVSNPDGYAPDGRPYFTFLDTTVDAELQPGAWTPTRTLRFSNPNQVGVQFDIEWLALGNAAPFVTSAPPLEAVADAPYAYDVQAVDPDGHALAFALLTSPAGMTIDADTGLLEWLPTLDDVGSHGVVVSVEDGWGGSAQQAFTLVVAPTGTNQPPSFTSVPTTSVSTGAPYTYASTALDPDDDPLVFELLSAPADMVVSSAGVVSWPFALPGDVPIALRVSDPSGASADQAWTLTVGATSSGPLPPIVLGAPGSTAAVDALYLYAPAVDSSAPVAFTLPTAPAGMAVDPETGRVTWTPTDGDVGSHPVTLVADNGSGSATQSWVVEVFDEPVNLAPVITSTPDLIAFVDEAWSYDANAIDPEAAPITWELVSGPAGMTIDGDSGLVQWTPPTAPDSVLVAVRALDPSGEAGNQVFTLPVFPTNNPPVFASSPITSVTVGNTYLYDAATDDLDAHAPVFALLGGPVGMAVNPLTGVVTWTPGPADIGQAPVTLGVSDGFGGSAEQSWTIDVFEDVTPPEVSLFVSAFPAEAFETVQVCVQVSDDTAVASRELTVDGVDVALDEAGCAFITPEMPGGITLVAMAEDASGNVGTDSLVLPVGPDAGSPLVEVVSPAPGATITKPEDMIVSISDDNPDGLTWSVDIRRIGTEVDDAIVIGSGTGEVDEGVVATFDPTVLPNDTWIVRILASDGFTLGGVEYAYELSGSLKPTQFSIAFDDLVTTLAGIPIVITRNYTSLDRSPGDFGPGWRLGFYGDVTDSAIESDSDIPLVQLLGDAPFGQGERVYVTRPDGKRVGFTFTGKQLGYPVPALWQARYEPDPGVTDTLEAVDLAPLMSNLGGQFFNLAVPYNPELYRFTTKDGVEYVIHERDGLQSITTAQGNLITVTPDGLFAESGEAIVFERNADGYITRIVEPPVPGDLDGPADLEYVYDGLTGDLIASIDQNQAATTYTYDSGRDLDHYLTEIMDPLGRPLVRSVYDDDGKLLAYCNAGADIDTLEGCVEFDTDTIALQQTISTAKGRRIDILYDERGNILKEIRFLDDGTTRDICRTYDEDDNLTSETDPAGNTTFFTHDEKGNVITQTDPAGRTWTFEYNDCGEVVLACDPLGNCTQSVFDDDCNRIMEIQPDGATRHWVYDDFGRQLGYTDATGNTWVASYLDNTAGLDVVDPDLPIGQVAFEQFGPNQETLYRIDRDGRRIDYVYDDAHQMIREVWDDGTVIEFTYDAAGQLRSMVAPDSSLAMDFSPLGAVTRVDTAGTPGAPPTVLDYTYDAHVLVTSVADSYGGLTTYDYDDLDLLVSVQQRTGVAGLGRDRAPAASGGLGLSGMSMKVGGGGVPLGAGGLERRVDFTYDDADLLRSMRRYADLGGTVPVTDTFLDYDCGGCPNTLTEIHHRRADASVLHDIDIVRDDSGRVTQITDAEGLHVYVNDGRGRILSVNHVGGFQPDETYSYDGEGNRLSSHLDATPPVYSYQQGAGGSRLVSDAEASYAYDNEGRVTLRTAITGETTEYVWDHRGRLVEVVLRDGVGVETGRASYVYDALDRRIRSTESGVTRHIVWDSRNPILILDDGGNVLERRMVTRDLDGILADEVGGISRWYHLDQVGSVRDVTDDTGAILEHLVYDSFGQVISGAVPGGTTMRFQGRDVSPLTGLADFRARWYDARLGRFTSLDPALPLQYVGFENAPHMMRDPLGLTAIISYACLAVAAYNNAVTITKPTVMVWKHWTPKALAGLGGAGDDLGTFPDIPFEAKALIKGICTVAGSKFPGAE